MILYFIKMTSHLVVNLLLLQKRYVWRIKYFAGIASELVIMNK